MSKTNVRKTSPTSGQVHTNAILTNISIAYMQNRNDFIADRVFPRVPVQKQSDTYYTYDKDDWFTDSAKKRAPATESAGGGYRQSDETYNCEVYAFHKDIDTQTRANYDAPLNADRDATEFVTHKLLLKRELEFVQNFLKSDPWDTVEDLDAGENYQFDDYDEDIISFVDQKRRDVKKKTGYKPNKLVLGGRGWDAIKNHPEILDRIKYTREAIDINPQLVARALDLDELIVSEGVYATNPEGEDLDMSHIVDDKALLLYTPQSPSLLTPSAGYIFAWEGYADNAYGVGVEDFWMQNIKADRIEGEMAFDQKVTGADLGVFMENVIG